MSVAASNRKERERKQRGESSLASADAPPHIEARDAERVIPTPRLPHELGTYSKQPTRKDCDTDNTTAYKDSLRGDRKNATGMGLQGW